MDKNQLLKIIGQPITKISTNYFIENFETARLKYAYLLTDRLVLFVIIFIRKKRI